MKGIAGCGIFKVAVDENGDTDGVERFSSVPKNVIIKPARKLISSWEWELANDKSRAAEEKTLRVDFCMGGNSQQEADDVARPRLS